jgi:tetratricopeptide (TPR) repeat protein
VLPGVWKLAGGALLAAALAGCPLAAPCAESAAPDPAAASTQPAPMDRAQALAALSSAEPLERRLAVLRLADIALAEDVAALVDALRDPDEVVRAVSERALWAVWGRSGDPAIDARLQEGTVLMGERRLDESIVLFSALVAERPDFAEAWNKRATALYLKGDYRASMADCAEVEKRNPWHFGMMAGMGQIWLRLGDLEKAEGWLGRALEVNPNMAGVAALLEATRQELSRRGRRDI